MIASIDTSDLRSYVDCCPEQITCCIRLQLQTFGPQKFDHFVSELWEFEPEDIKSVLDALVELGIVTIRRCVCGDWYYPKGWGMNV